MNIFDVIGPVMVGPSSSHTAGAVRIGYVARQLLGEEVREAKILLYGSFLATGKGHGTDKALTAGLLGMQTDDYRIPKSIEIAEDKGMKIAFGEAVLKEAHPNTAQLYLKGISGKTMELVGQSLGGGLVILQRLMALRRISLGRIHIVVHNLDQPGHVSEVTSMLAHKGVNIATMQLYRSSKGGKAVMVVECDQEVPQEGIRWLERVEGVLKVTYLGKSEEK